MKRFTVSFLLLIVVVSVSAQQWPVKETQTLNKPAAEKKWFETFSIRGYLQFRYNRLLETNPKMGNEQGDRSWGENGGFFMRRARIIFSGQINKHISFYVQPDFASSASATSLHFGQIRDAYIDIGLDKDNEYRLRVGQSKVPFGFENMQSSQNRLPLDRNDALNSAVLNERDMGVFFYWAPKEKRELFANLVRDGLKGSGDYGVFAFGAYNGQTANKPEQNNQPHIITRFSYPFAVGNQIIEPGIQAYTGKYVVTRDQISTGTKVNADRNYLDQRIAGTFILYPKPFGIQAEYNFGKGPSFNKVKDSIETTSLQGGYITVSCLMRKNQQVLIPFARAHYYDGGKKHELDARKYNVKELEIGVEWQPSKQFELVVMYTFSSRQYEDYILQDNLQKGSLLRLQAQVNF
jgi:hypothetical protein